MDNPWKYKKTKQTLASVRARCSSRSRSSLQTLPVELLEIIFLYAMDLALPRSSPLIGAKLSGKATLLRLFIAGFHETWDQYFGLSKMESFVLLMNKGETAESDEALQSALLSLPWVDIDFILQAQQSWADKHARGRCYHHQEVVGSFDGDSPEEQKYKQHILQHKQGSLKFDARACFEADYVRALPLITAPGLGFLGRQWGTMDILPKARIPMHLITGPWDEEKRRRLYWLTRARYCLDGEPFNLIPYPWEVKLACLDAVLIHAEKPDRLVINCLIGPWIFTDLPQDEAHKRILTLCRRLVQAEGPPDIVHFVGEVIERLDADGQFPDYHIDRGFW
ncbi:hypothetical protein E4U59_003355 [Claviceps monticola]|nr:hypothetical protein E4U59_003355 [Claviceps monticola]